MLNIENLLECLPESADEFNVIREGTNINVVHIESNKHDVDLSQLILSDDITEKQVVLKYIAITESFKNNGYGRKVLTELFNQCQAEHTELFVDTACPTVKHVFDTLTSGSESVTSYQVIEEENEEPDVSLVIKF